MVIASFGSAQGLDTRVFSVDIASDPSTPTPQYEKPVRYGKKPEIHHIFRADPKNPPKAISFFFAAAVLATLPALFIGVSAFPSSLSYGFPPKKWLSMAADRGAPRLLVALPGRQRQPFAPGTRQGASVPRGFLRVHHRHGGRLLPLLHHLEPFPGPPGDSGRWCRCHRLGTEGAGRGADQETRRSAIGGQGVSVLRIYSRQGTKTEKGSNGGGPGRKRLQIKSYAISYGSKGN